MATDTPESDREGDLPHPRDARDFIGNAAAVETFAQAMRSGRMPAAWLIGGPRGIGKATLAYRVARALLSGRPLAPNDEGAGTRAPALQTHPDLLVLRRPYDEKAKRFKQTLPVEEVRKVHGFLGRHAGAGGWRICIVDAADDLNASAANALLKSLEEPPRSAMFLILAHAPARLLPTIRSRCRRLLLRPLDDAELVPWLQAQEENMSDSDAHALARLAEGSPGRALALARAGGLALYRDLGALLEPTPEPAKLYALADRLSRADAEQDYQTATELLSLWLSRLVRAGGGRDTGEILPGDGARMAKLRAGASLERWVELWENLQHLVARADAVALDRRQVLLSIFAGVGRVAEGGSPDLLLERI